MGAVAIDFDFFKQRKGHAVIAFAKAANFIGRARFLRAELVAREGQHFDALVLELLIYLFQPLVLRGKTAVAGGVDDQQDLALVLFEIDRLAVQAGGGKIVNGGGHDDVSQNGGAG